MTAADRVVVALAAALVGALFAAFWQPAQPAATAEIRSGNHLVGRYALDRERRIEVAGELGASRLEIRDRRIRFAHSPCRNKICVHSGWLAHRGDASACVPNRISISLLGGAESGLDAVSF